MEFDGNDIAETLKYLYRRLFNMLPSNTIIQHQLFNTERYESSSKKTIATRGFINWLQDYVLNGFVCRDIERRRARKQLNIMQPSLRLR